MNYPKWKLGYLQRNALGLIAVVSAVLASVFILAHVLGL
jgi:hypothetical protein